MTGKILHLGVLAGLRSEARWLLPNVERRTVALSAARRPLAEAAAAGLAAQGATHLLSFGLAGGLDPALAPGTLLLPDVLVSPDGTERRVDAGWHAALEARLADFLPVVGRHLGADLAIADVAEKASQFARTGALAVDMESHVLARNATGQPFAILRVVCDAAQDVLPPAALVGVRPDGGTDLPRILASILCHPRQIPALGRLAGAAKAADRILKSCGARPLLPG